MNIEMTLKYLKIRNKPDIDKHHQPYKFICFIETDAEK